MENDSPPALAHPPPAAADAAVPALERVARLAAATFAVPFAAVVRFGAGGDGVAAPVSWGRLGAAVPDPRLACASLPADAALVVVEDAAKDARVLLPAEARFFACARADGTNGHALGAVCLLDDTPRTLAPAETERLADLAAFAALALEAAALTDACAQAEARFQALSEATFDALLILEAGVVLDANDRAAELFGYADVDALIGRSLLDLVPDHLLEEVELRLGITGRHEAAVLRADGTEVPVEVSATAFPHQGRLLRITAVRAGD
ncbi:MAG TPA: PAS domain S-box protein [Rubricoccaceae bacterium]|nr:PAS domain S-box protein [Rubricoccaceae bacterium]